MVKGGENRDNTIGKGWGTFLPTFPPSKRRISGRIWGAPATTWAQVWSGSRRGGVGGRGRKGWRGPKSLALSRQPTWRDKIVAPVHVARQEGHIIVDAAQCWLGPPAWPPCRATCTGATEAICRAGASGATKRATLSK